VTPAPDVGTLRPMRIGILGFPRRRLATSSWWTTMCCHVGLANLVHSGMAPRLLSVIDLFFSASRIRPVRTRQAQARR
jgi:hypothetical protein